jgi:hypothetical protein
MNETVIRISDDGRVMVEKDDGGVKSFKQIAPDTLLECINMSLLRGAVHTGVLPKNCLSFSAYDDGNRDVILLHSENKADINYFGTDYKDFPLPRLVFGFRLSKEGRVSSCRLGVIDNSDMLKPETKMYHYPLSNVSGFHLCTGNNSFPKCNSLHTLASLPYYITAMPNNNDYFKPSNNKQGLEMRDLLELLKDKSPEYYYSDILIPSGKTLADFIKQEGR